MAYRAACLVAALVAALVCATVPGADAAQALLTPDSAAESLVDAGGCDPGAGTPDTSDWAPQVATVAPSRFAPPALPAPRSAASADRLRAGVRPVPYHPPSLL